MRMDDLDRRILDALQHDFPLRERPFDILAQRLGVEPDLLWERVEALRNSGVIRRLGASLDSRKLGFRSTLAAVRVRPDLVDRAAEAIGRHPEVTHSYLRDHELGFPNAAPGDPGVSSPRRRGCVGGPFNIWFTIIASDDEKMGAILREIQAQLSLEPSDVLNLPMKRLFKLDARFHA